MQNDTFEQAQTFRNNGDIEKAISLYTKVRNASISRDPLLAAECLHMIGVSLYQSQKFIDAESSLLLSQQEFESLGRSDFIGFVLRDRGAVARSQKDYEKAKSFLRESVSLLHNVSNVGHEGISLVKLGRVLADEGNYEEAIATITQGISLLTKSSELFFLSSSYFDLAKVELLKGDISAAKEHAKTSLSLLDSSFSLDEFLERRKSLAEFFTSLPS
jgi:tetratricopeptide (TPR) repeat protein